MIFFRMMMTMMTMMMIVGPGSKSVFVERSVGKKERAEVDILGLPQKDEKCVLFEPTPPPLFTGKRSTGQ